MAVNTTYIQRITNTPQKTKQKQRKRELGKHGHEISYSWNCHFKLPLEKAPENSAGDMGINWGIDN